MSERIAKSIFIDSRTGEKYLEGLEFDYKKAGELVASIIRYVKYVDLHIEGEKSFAKFTTCFSNEEIEIKQGNYLLQSEKIIPGTMPYIHYYKSVDKEEFFKNFKPLSVTLNPSSS